MSEIKSPNCIIRRTNYWFFMDIKTCVNDYRDRYGLPWKHGLCGKATSLKLSNVMNKRRKNGFAPDTDAAREKSKHVKKRHDQPYFVKVKTENLRSANDKRKKYFDEDFQKVLVNLYEINIQ